MAEKNMVEEAVSILDASSPELGQRFKAHFDIDLSSCSAATQIKILNGYWRVELGVQDAPTADAREKLVDHIEPKDWLRHFKRSVAPVIAQCWIPSEVPAPTTNKEPTS